MKNVCVVCGKEFESSHKSMCCSDCKIRKCIICGKEFELKHPYTAVTCSRKCAGEYRKRTGAAKASAEKAKKTLEERYGVSNSSELQKFKKTCKWCGKEFETTSARQEYCGDDYGSCPVCGKQVKIKDMSKGPQACSKACRQKLIEQTSLERYGDKVAANSEQGREKAKQTNQAKYGVDHYSKTSEYKEKLTKTMNERYGVDHALQNDEIKKKWHETNQEKYGTDTPLENEEIRAKARATQEANGGIGFSREGAVEHLKEVSKERYGTEFPTQSEEVKEQIKQTNLNKYGTTNPASSPDIRSKIVITSRKKYGASSYFASELGKSEIKKSVQEKYGVDNVFQAAETKDKIKDTLQDKYGVDNPMKSEELKKKAQDTNVARYGDVWWGSSETGIKARMSDPSKYNEFIKFTSNVEDYLKQFEEAPTYYQLALKLGVTTTAVSKYVLESGCQSYISYNKSTMEQEVYDFLKSIDPDIDIIRNDRTRIAPMELDLYLPEHNLAIECNPTYTHNSSKPTHWVGGVVPKNYHQMKSRKARDAGINLFHVFGYEWSNHKEIVESMIRNRLGKNTHKLYARDLEIKEVSFDEANSFLLNNHILGQTSARIRYGLYDGEELVSLMCFNKPRYTMGYHKEYSENTWELSRFCSLLNTNVVGGASKLFKHFLDSAKPDLVISFSSLSDTTGSVYEILGFKQEAEVDPGYVWVSIKTDVAYNRASCQKRLLPKLLNEADLDIENQTEDEIMESHGFVKVYNSGLIRWIYR